MRHPTVGPLTAAVLTAAFIGLTPAAAMAAGSPIPPGTPAPPAASALAAAGRAAGAADTLDTLRRFFAAPDPTGAAGSLLKETGGSGAARVEGATIPVRLLSTAFVAAEPGSRAALTTPVAKVAFLATRAVSADGRTASVWTAEQDGRWQVVNIATGDDETRFAALGAARLAGGTVFREPQIDAWYVQRGDRVLPLDPEATTAIGAGGTTLGAYQRRVHRSYGDKLPGSAYAGDGAAGGYGPDGSPAPVPRPAPAVRAQAPGADPAAPTGSSAHAPAPADPAVLPVAGVLLALGLAAVTVLRPRRR
ncbi:hypothetical protein [Streptomyces liangshanensis]|uniref:hypothetical protein n=1 Tax=Streptomyces liangshanensis TaxID=2717324 RepID=UPI0036D88325